MAACPAVEYSPLHCKSLERAKTEALNSNYNNYDRVMFLPEFVKEDLTWWQENLPISRRKIRSGKFSLEIFSDASLTGWGIFCAGQKAHGLWKIDEQKLHINSLELMAAFIGLKCFAADLRECEILLRVDNSTAKAYINKMGGTQFPHLHKLACDIWNWCEARSIWVHAAYIPSKENDIADEQSRLKNIDTEWELAGYAFRKIIKQFGNVAIDLFASRANAKCRSYCSWERDPDALTIDSFTISWANTNFYAFPPFALLNRVIQKIIKDKATGVLVVPLWTAQPWYPLFQKLIVGPTILFKPNNKLLLSPFRDRHHPLARKLTLVAAKLSGTLF